MFPHSVASRSAVAPWGVALLALLVAGCPPSNSLPCDVDADCPDGRCWLGACGPSCRDDGDCARGEACAAGTCVAAPACLAPEDCAAGFACTGGHCRCTADAACAANQTCREGRCETSVSCVADVDCTAASGGAAAYCQEGHCRPATPCAAADACAPGEACIGALCVPDLCRGHADCGGERRCVEGGCVAPPPPSDVLGLTAAPTRAVLPIGARLHLTLTATTADGGSFPLERAELTAESPDVVALAAEGTITGLRRGPHRRHRHAPGQQRPTRAGVDRRPPGAEPPLARGGPGCRDHRPPRRGDGPGLSRAGLRGRVRGRGSWR